MSAPERRPDLMSVLVIGYNSADWLRRCLTSLLGDGAPSRPFEVIVVDNDSNPPLAGEIGDLLSRVRMVTLQRNVGFANAVNVAASMANGERLLLLNPDTDVLPGALDALWDFLSDDPSRGIVGGRTLEPDGSLDPRSCWAQPTLWSQICFALLLPALRPRSALFNPEAMPGWERDTVREVGVVTGCLLLADAGLWDQLGGFDPDFFMYGEDVDLSRRARALGWHPAVTPDAAIVHAGGASSTTAAKTVMVLRGKATLYRKHGTPLTRPVSRVLLRTGVGVRAALERIRSRGREADTAVWGGAWQQRREWEQGWTADRRVPVQIAADTGVAS
jgi:N-acetylglucosaminyl-diphospho-decaprenol L-rhamnosyltransferase